MKGALNGDGFEAGSIYATTLESEAAVCNKFKGGKANLKELRRMGILYLDRVDAQRLRFHPTIGQHSFDRVYFNFPQNPTDPGNVKLNRLVIFKFFVNCHHILGASGRVHMLFRTSADYKKSWRLKKIANAAGFRRLRNCPVLNMGKHKLYRPVKGFGDRPDTPFETRHSVEYMFVLKSKGESDSSDSDSDSSDSDNDNDTAPPAVNWKEEKTDPAMPGTGVTAGYSTMKMACIKGDPSLKLILQREDNECGCQRVVFSRHTAAQLLFKKGENSAATGDQTATQLDISVPSAPVQKDQSAHDGVDDDPADDWRNTPVQEFAGLGHLDQ